MNLTSYSCYWEGNSDSNILRVHVIFSYPWTYCIKHFFRAFIIVQSLSCYFRHFRMPSSIMPIIDSRVHTTLLFYRFTANFQTLTHQKQDCSFPAPAFPWTEVSWCWQHVHKTCCFFCRPHFLPYGYFGHGSSTYHRYIGHCFTFSCCKYALFSFDGWFIDRWLSVLVLG